MRQPTSLRLASVTGNRVRASERRSVASLVVAAVCALVLAQACWPTEPSTPTNGAPPRVALRLVLSSNVAGAIEPCGCTPDQLGGLDRLGAWLRQAEPTAESTALFAVGSLAYGPAPSDGERPQQDRWKAETIASAGRQLGLVAWTPGPTDLGEGPKAITELAERAASPIVATNLSGGPVQPGQVLRLGKLSVGVIGVTSPPARRVDAPGTGDGPSPGTTSAAFAVHEGQAPGEPGLAAAVIDEARRLRAEGAQLLVLLAAIPRGEALRLADSAGDLDVLAIADPGNEGVPDDEPLPAELVGKTLVVQTANHLQTVAVVDVYVADGAASVAGPLELRDLGGIDRAARAAGIARQIRQLEIRIGNWTRTGAAVAGQIAAREADLERLRAERAGLEQVPNEPVTGNGFRFRSLEIREALGRDEQTAELMAAFYRRVNEHNRQAYADRLPPPLRDGEAGYVGVATCTADCHQLARQFWETRPHARAYETLVKDAKEYNLECVGCHVTGYERPGGSTVTHNDGLRAVQCEECHGPGSRHQADAEAPGLILRKPEPGFCVERCHHPPHVAGFDADEKMPLILGPGHGAS